jgi:hypothetical protein
MDENLPQRDLICRNCGKVMGTIRQLDDRGSTEILEPAGRPMVRTESGLVFECPHCHHHHPMIELPREPGGPLRHRFL